MILNELIKHLQTLVDKGHGELEVYVTHGASGACDPVGYPFVKQVDNYELGEVAELEAGTEYIDIYIGH